MSCFEQRDFCIKNHRRLGLFMNNSDLRLSTVANEVLLIGDPACRNNEESRNKIYNKEGTDLADQLCLRAYGLELEGRTLNKRSKRLGVPVQKILSSVQILDMMK